MALRSEEVTNCIQREPWTKCSDVWRRGKRSTRHDFDQPAGRWVFATALDNSFFARSPLELGSGVDFGKSRAKIRSLGLICRLFAISWSVSDGKAVTYHVAVTVHAEPGDLLTGKKGRRGVLMQQRDGAHRTGGDAERRHHTD